MWEAHGYIWHGYEVEGLQNIPDSGPALLVYYHGAIPIDYYYLTAKCVIYKKRLIYSVGDRFLFKIPGKNTGRSSKFELQIIISPNYNYLYIIFLLGWTHLMEVLKLFPVSLHTRVKVLNEGNLLAISPGGVREGVHFLFLSFRC